MNWSNPSAHFARKELPIEVKLNKREKAAASHVEVRADADGAGHRTSLHDRQGYAGLVTNEN